MKTDSVNLRCWMECVEESLKEHGIPASIDVIRSIAVAMQENASALSDMSFYSTGGPSTTPAVDYEKLYRSTLAQLETYQREHKVLVESAARRNHVSPQEVSVEGDRVMIYPRGLG